MVEPISVSSDETGGVTSQIRPNTPVENNDRRLGILEKTARNNSASIGRGGIAVYDGGKFRWFNYNYDNQIDPDDPANLDALVFEIGSFEETDLEDFGVAFRYYFPNKDDRGGLPVVVMGAFAQVGDASKDSHGLAVYAIGADPDRPVLAASDDGIVLQKSSDRDPDGGAQTILRALKDSDDLSFPVGCTVTPLPQVLEQFPQDRQRSGREHHREYGRQVVRIDQSHTWGPPSRTLGYQP